MNRVNPIVSEDFADLLVEYSGDENILRSFPNAYIEIVNFLHAVVHIPVSLVTNQIIRDWGYSVMPRLYGTISIESLEASGILRIRNIPNFNLLGTGVLLGFIDTGIDYTNPIFQYADNTTRIVSIWDQTIQTGPTPQGRSYGTEYTREQINEALQSENPLGIVPSMDESGHGTMVAGIAGGNPVNTGGPAGNFSGVVPGAEFVVVKVKPAKQYLKNFFMIPESALCFQENDILFAMEYLLRTAYQLGRPIAICMALGSSQGGHDGSGILSNYFSLVATSPGVVLVIAAGNEGNGRRHYSGMVNTATGYDTVELNVGENESGFSMELWGDSPSVFSIDIRSPSGEYIPRIAVGMDENREISFIFEETVLYVDYQMVEEQSGDQLILVRFRNPTSGIWRFNVYERGDMHLGFNIWLPMANFISSDTFFLNSDPYVTILSTGNGEIPITVTAYNDEDDSLYPNASRGYTRSDVIKPNIAAPGVDITGPNLEQGFSSYSGTSTSAAHTTGVAAMVLEWGIVQGNLPGMSTVEFKKLVMRGARRDADIHYPNRDWGYGILDVFNVFDSLRTGIVV
ncbi:subtilisin family serine protease [Anaerotaenia torta]|uniref:S8 family peptidase n=1 Tax=Anaerotaenia torta TaxID=433293 RepID=UPI003D220F5D